jgi:hypothetical protein
MFVYCVLRIPSRSVKSINLGKNACGGKGLSGGSGSGLGSAEGRPKGTDICALTAPLHRFPHVVSFATFGWRHYELSWNLSYSFDIQDSDLACSPSPPLSLSSILPPISELNAAWQLRPPSWTFRVLHLVLVSLPNL